MPLFNLLYNAIGMNRPIHPDKIKELQDQRLKKLLCHVLTHSTFYREYYRQYGIGLKDIDDIRLKDLPIINKQMMMEHYDDFVCDSNIRLKTLEKFNSNPENMHKKLYGKYRVIHTSGSTGRVGFFVYGPKDWDMLKAMVMRRVVKPKIRPFKRTKAVFFGATDGNYAGVSLVTDAPQSLFNTLLLSINSPHKEVIEKIQKFQPETLSGYSSAIYLLAMDQIKHRIYIRPKRIICSGDMLTPRMKQSIIQAFGIIPVNFYAASESVGFGADCDRYKLHLFEDWHCFELMDENNIPVKDGQVGRLILTNLYNYTQPLLRYQMNDQLLMSHETCDCGSRFKIVRKIAGRQEDYLWFTRKNGERDYIHPLLLSELYSPGLERFQIVQTSSRSFVLKVSFHGEEHIQELKKSVDRILREKGLHEEVQYSIEKVQNMMNDPKTGKFKLIVPATA